MDVKKHCGLLTKFKNDGMKLSTYMSKRWFVSKVMLFILALVKDISNSRLHSIRIYYRRDRGKPPELLCGEKELETSKRIY
jgi:hypothetical protein